MPSLNWLRRFRGEGNIPATKLPVPRKGSMRGNRTETIAALRAEIAQLQQELIVRGSDQGVDQHLPIGQQARERQEAVERRLADMQRELATYQARV